MRDTPVHELIDAAAAEGLVQRLVGIPGRSGEEEVVAEAIAQACVDAGVPKKALVRDRAHRASPYGGRCGNLIVKLAGTKGRTREPRRLLMAHMDTVPPCVGCRPVRRGRRLVSADPATALGGDNRAGCATVLTALRTALAHDLSRPPLTLLFTVQEEVGLCGARHAAVARLGRPTMAFNFDGGDPGMLVVGATGAFRMTIEVTGKAAHAGNRPERGVSAVAIAALAIADLQKRGWHGLIRKGRSRGTSNVGPIEGGSATNVVAERVVLRAEARSHAPAFRRRIVEAYRAAFERAARSVTSDTRERGAVRFHVSHDYESFKLPRTAAVVKEAARAVQQVGVPLGQRVVNGGLDANWINRHGVPTVTLGCGQHDIHMAGEWLDLDAFLDACRIATMLATGG